MAFVPCLSPFVKLDDVECKGILFAEYTSKLARAALTLNHRLAENEKRRIPLLLVIRRSCVARSHRCAQVDLKRVFCGRPRAIIGAPRQRLAPLLDRGTPVFFLEICRAISEILSYLRVGDVARNIRLGLSRANI